MAGLRTIRDTLCRHADPEQARLLQRFFKTGPGEYAEGDVFLGIKVPALRGIARQCRTVSFDTIGRLLRARIHEERFLALLLLMEQYRQSDNAGKERIYRFYLDHTAQINNWDLVDLSAKNIVGDFLRTRDRAVLYTLARSSSVWERRIAVLVTFHFIGYNDFDDMLNIARGLLCDQHDLIHKAVGWMLREVGKRDLGVEERFLKKYAACMPRTMLRYAIERFPSKKRKRYLRKKTAEVRRRGRS